MIEWKRTMANGYSIINDIFSGMMETIVTCSKCNNKTIAMDMFNEICLNIPEIKTENVTIDDIKTSYTLDELISFYVEPETMTDHKCGYCNEKNMVTKQTVFYQLPDTLIIVIKKYMRLKSQLIKTHIKINYNHTLTMNKYMSKNSNELDTNKNQDYELYSVIKHSGELRSGHYYGYNKNITNNKWYMHNDGSVYCARENDPIDCNGYVLFYRKINN
jgi:ubiquitin C-terminal hydrolase